MISQEDGEIVKIYAFERELCAIAQIEEGSIEEENLLEGKLFLFKIRDIVTNVWHWPGTFNYTLSLTALH